MLFVNFVMLCLVVWLVCLCVRKLPYCTSYVMAINYRIKSAGLRLCDSFYAAVLRGTSSAHQSGAGGNMQDTRDRSRALDDRKRALLLERQELVVAAAILHGGNGGN